MGTGFKIQVDGVTKVFHQNGQSILAIQNATFHVRAGSFVSIIGPSGCGKSTLFNMIAGLLRPSDGVITADGQSIVGKAGYVGYMLQKDMLLPWRTILDNIILGMEIRRVPRKNAIEKALPLMKTYGLDGFENLYPHQLSGGMRQRAALLRTLLYDRDILLLDEPFGALDAQTRFAMQAWLLSIWKDFGKTILFVTHDIDEAIFLSDEVFVFSTRPGTVKSCVPIDLPRPRSRDSMTSESFMRLKKLLLTQLEDPGKEAPNG